MPRAFRLEKSARTTRCRSFGTLLSLHLRCHRASRELAPNLCHECTRGSRISSPNPTSPHAPSGDVVFHLMPATTPAFRKGSSAATAFRVARVLVSHPLRKPSESAHPPPAGGRLRRPPAAPSRSARLLLP